MKFLATPPHAASTETTKKELCVETPQKSASRMQESATCVPCFDKIRKTSYTFKLVRPVPATALFISFANFFPLFNPLLSSGRVESHTKHLSLPALQLPAASLMQTLAKNSIVCFCRSSKQAQLVFQWKNNVTSPAFFSPHSGAKGERCVSGRLPQPAELCPPTRLYASEFRLRTRSSALPVTVRPFATNAAANLSFCKFMNRVTSSGPVNKRLIIVGRSPGPGRQKSHLDLRHGHVHED